MNETLARFQTLPKDVTDKVLDIILETQELLGNGSLVVLGKLFHSVKISPGYYKI